MAIPTAALNLLTFPQSFAGGVLTVRFLCLPQRNPVEPLAAGEPSFADANLVFEAQMISGLEHLPRQADAVATGPLVLAQPPLQKAALFAELANTFRISRAPPVLAAAAPTFRKAVMPSYRALVGSRQLSRWLANADDYACAQHAGLATQPAKPVVLNSELRWGELLAHALRQPALAMALGLVGEVQIALPDAVPDAAFFARGGWVYISLHSSSDCAANPALLSLHAARVPPLVEDRGLYAAALFPVDGPSPADDVFRDAERYDRGFARLVHASQTEDGSDAIRLAWDDEQLAEIFNRQVSAQTSTTMGTAGYRVDVRDSAAVDAGDSSWHSLQQVASIRELMVGALSIGAYAGESQVEVVPLQASRALPGEFWMPPYFSTWRGGSLVLTDPDLTALHRGLAVDAEFANARLGREQSFLPVGEQDVPLRYGRRYQFRVRMADLSRGGPPVQESTPAEAGRDVHHTCEVSFQRRRPPGAVQVLKRPARGDLQLVLGKPELGYPELLFTGAHRFADLAASVPGNAARQREPGLPDPDVVQLHITLEVKALQGDSAAWWPLYQTVLDFAEATLSLQLEPVEQTTLEPFAADVPPGAALPVPTARDLRLVLVALGRDQPGYFASNEARQSPAATVEFRVVGLAEDMLLPAPPTLSSFFFRAAGGAANVPRPLTRLAHEVGLRADALNDALTLTGLPGTRTVFGCSAALRHTLAPDASSLRLASEAELNQRWVNVLRFDVARDWSWDALAVDGVQVQRRLSRPGQADVLEFAGTMSLPKATARWAIETATDPADMAARAPRRQFSQAVFIDAIDPKPRLRPAGTPPEHPAELTVSYELSFVFKDGLPAPAPAQASTLLPITTPPLQVPRLVSAGIALSPPNSAADYSATEQRQRMLWLEFEALPADPDDAYFVRVLACAADPLLTKEDIPNAIEPALALDAEWMRVIEPGQPRDDNGLRAMQMLMQPSRSGAHYLIALPDGMQATDADMLSLFTYEIRIGHNSARWSTAQGRFGPALRVAGVQHPPPPLVCQSMRNALEIRVRAPFATPLQDGRQVRPPEGPKTRLWALLYARVEQADAQAWRNLVLMRAPLLPPRGDLAERLPETAGPLLFGEGAFALVEVQRLLARHGLPANAPLTSLVVEFHTEPDMPDPLGVQLGHARWLRVSPLIPVPDVC